MLPVKLYLLQTYIVTSKPNLISVADGFVHIMLSFLNKLHYNYNYTDKLKTTRQRGIILC